MNKKVIFAVFLFALAWNMTIFLFRDVINGEENIEFLEKSKADTESEIVAEFLEVYNHESGKVVNMPLETYIMCVLSAEMPVSYGLEALKAQAVAARTYTLYCISSGKHTDADVCTDYRHCQAYKDYGEVVEAFNDLQRSLIRQAVEETANEILVYDGEVINAVYHASSYNMTESAQNVWGTAVPYLVSVPSENESGMPGFESVLKLSTDGFFEKLRYAGIEGDFSENMISVSKNSSGRVEYVTVGTQNGEEINVPGTEMRNIFDLRSCSFDITKQQNTVIFTVRGYGHGVGMSQYGAKVMAQSGKTYDQILLHYYTGCKIKKLTSTDCV